MSRWRSAITVVLLAGAALAAGGPPGSTRDAASAAVSRCGAAEGYQLCLFAPDSPLSGEVGIRATLHGSGPRPHEVIFAYGPDEQRAEHLLSDFEAPYEFRWPTGKYVDGSGVLTVRTARLGEETAPVSVPVRLSNGISSQAEVRRYPTNWSTYFSPRVRSGPPVLAAVGDGGNGATRSNAVARSIADSPAEVLLYLGDLYEKATPAEFLNNYGRQPRGGRPGTDWGALAPWTQPVFGNHERFNPEAWRDYWRGRPRTATFVHAGVRILLLDSECADGCGTSSAQYAWAQRVLANNSQRCVVAAWHRPVLSAVQDNEAMRPLWALLARSGGDLVLNGHTHSMSAYAPLNADLATSPGAHQVQLISGGGGGRDGGCGRGRPTGALADEQDGRRRLRHGTGRCQRWPRPAGLGVPELLRLARDLRRRSGLRQRPVLTRLRAAHRLDCPRRALTPSRLR